MYLPASSPAAVDFLAKDSLDTTMCRSNASLSPAWTPGGEVLEITTVFYHYIRETALKSLLNITNLNALIASSISSPRRRRPLTLMSSSPTRRRPSLKKGTKKISRNVPCVDIRTIFSVEEGEKLVEIKGRRQRRSGRPSIHPAGTALTVVVAL